MEMANVNTVKTHSSIWLSVRTTKRGYSLALAVVTYKYSMKIIPDFAIIIKSTSAPCAGENWDRSDRND